MQKYHFVFVKREMPILLTLNCERTHFFSVWRDLDTASPPPLSATLRLIGRLPSNGPGRRDGLMVSALISVSSGSGPSPGLGHCVVFVDKILYTRSASLNQGV